VLVRGRIDHKERGETKLVAQEIETFDPDTAAIERAEAAAEAAVVRRRLTVEVPPAAPAEFLEDLKRVVEEFPGEHEVILRVGERTLLLGERFRVTGDARCRAALDELAESVPSRLAALPAVAAHP
jgi:hypothetical protein